MVQFYTPKRRLTDKKQLTGRKQLTSKKQLTVTVNSLDAFGQGVAHHQGKALFIAGALPSESVDIQLVEDKKNYAKANVLRRLNDSEQRVTPQCAHFTICGGCQQQHASRQLQHSSKLAALINLIEREIKTDFVVGPIISGNSYGYRRRTRLSLFYQNRSATLQMGFRQQGSNEIVNITQCPILCPELASLLPPLRACLTQLDSVKKLGHVELVLADNGPIITLRHLVALTEEDREALRSFAKTYHVSIYLADNKGELTKLIGSEPWYVINDLRLMFQPQDFIQVNAEINQQMVGQALTWLDLHAHDHVLDLFCGMGNFTLPIAQRAGAVVGIEGVASLVAMGQQNAKNNGLNNVTFLHQDLQQEVSQQTWVKRGFNKVLLDPARAGAAAVMPQVIKFSPSHIVYVSCHPATLARDSKTLIEAGYYLAEVVMLDMFPHTAHLESMALFKRQ